MAHPQAGAGLFIHLTEHEDRLFQHPTLGDLAVEILRLSGAFSDATEDAGALVSAGHVVDEFHDEHRLADPGSPEEPRLAPTLEGSKHVDHLDTGLERLGFGRSTGQRNRTTVDGPLLQVDKIVVAQTIDHPSEHVEGSPPGGIAHTDGDGRTRVDELVAAGQPLNGCKRNGTHGLAIEMADDLDRDGDTRSLLERRFATVTPRGTVGCLQKRPEFGQWWIHGHIDHTAVHPYHQT